MKSFRDKFPGLTEEQIRIKYKLWEKEKEREKDLLESLKKKKSPFRIKDDDGEEGLYDGSLDIYYNHGGIVSDAVLVGSNVCFKYDDLSFPGVLKYTTTDSEGRFNTPRSFARGSVIISGGIDSVNGLQYNGQFSIDAAFYHNYRAVTPLTHIINHIWERTPTRVPKEATNVVNEFLNDFMPVRVGGLNHEILFNDDHVKLTLNGIEGAKEIQAINTLIEIHSDLIGSLRANNISEFNHLKINTYNEIGNALLTRINGQESSKYFEDIFKFHYTGCKRKHEECCMELISRASDVILGSLDKDVVESTKEIQAINLAVKTEWCERALHMTNDDSINKRIIWDSIEKKNPIDLMDSINIPV